MSRQAADKALQTASLIGLEGVSTHSSAVQPHRLRLRKVRRYGT